MRRLTFIIFFLGILALFFIFTNPLTLEGKVTKQTYNSIILDSNITLKCNSCPPLLNKNISLLTDKNLKVLAIKIK